jgi:protein-tyrosine phosphatase
MQSRKREVATTYPPRLADEVHSGLWLGGSWVDEEAVRAMADTIVAASRKNMQTLVRCHAGLNRSAIVIAVALTELTGRGGASITRSLRRVRSPYVLSNETFARWWPASPERPPTVSGHPRTTPRT